MSSYASLFIEGPSQFMALFAVALVWLAFSALGAAVGGRERLAETDHLAGWALVSFLFVLSGVFLKVPFVAVSVVAAVAAVAAGVFAWRRDGFVLPRGAWRIVVLGLPLLIMVSAMRGSQWDEFSDWLVIPRYMLAADAFPSAETPFPSATFAGYPYGWHFITYLASRISGRLLESAGALSNVVLLFGFALLAARLMIIGAGRHPDGERIGWPLAALAMLAATLINPTFAQKVVLTAYAETSTAVAAGTAAVLSWFLLEALGGREFDRARRLAWSLGLVLALLINLKQATLVLVVLIVLATVFIALRERSVPIVRLIRLLPAVIGPAAGIYLAWRYHVTTQLTASELSLMPFAEWNIALIPQIMAKMFEVLSKKGYYLALGLVLVAFGVRGFWLSRSPFDRFAALAAMVFLGYNAFLLFAYVTTFGAADALRAASYWRYNMHLGAIVVAFATYGGAVAWRRHLAGRWQIRRLAWLPVVVIVAAPFVFAEKLRFDRDPATVHFRMVGAEVARMARPEDRVFVADPRGSGESSAALSFELADRAKSGGFVSAFFADRLRVLTSAMARPEVSMILVYSIAEGYEEALGVKLPGGSTYLLRRAETGAWKQVESWPQPAHR